MEAQEVIPNITDTEVYKTEKGTSTSRRPDYSQLHIYSMSRVAAIYEEGEVKHGRDNWKNGIHDEAFKRDRANHAFQHLKLWMEGDRTVDHLAKVGWFCDMMMEIERLEVLEPKSVEVNTGTELYDVAPHDETAKQQTREEVYQSLVEEESTNPVKSALSNLLRLRR